MNCRSWLTARFIENVGRANPTQEIKRVMVVGGSGNEPELKLFQKAEVEIFFAGIENHENLLNFRFLDLNITSSPSSLFDLVICNQVLEHVYDLKTTFQNLSNLVKVGGLLWITCPANNFRHGSPDFFSAGYSKEFLERNLHQFQVLDLGELSCERIYLYRHLLNVWPTDSQLKFPLVYPLGIQGRFLYKVWHNTRTLMKRFVITFSSSNLELDGKYPIETFGLFMRNKQEFSQSQSGSL